MEKPMASRRTILALPMLAASMLAARTALAAEPVRIGQATTSLSFLPIWAARALDSFAQQDLALTWAAVPGGDPTSLAALDSGDLDLVAVGGETALQAIAKGQPYSIVYSLMSRMSLDLVVGPKIQAKLGDPLKDRLAALKGITIGVSAVGGAQDRAARWLAAQGGLGRTEVQIAMAGGPPALQAALENRRIDAFILSPPEGGIAEAGGYGRMLISLAADFPALRNMPFLSLVAKRPFAQEQRIIRSVRALQAAARALHADTEGTAAAIAAKYFPRAASGVIASATRGMLDGVTDGSVQAEAVDALIRFGAESGNPIGPINAAAWTNRFVGAD
jgi:NitT/TauT family transport system substrate-binding protein